MSTPFNYATPLGIVPAIAYNIDVNRIVETEVFSRIGSEGFETSVRLTGSPLG